MEFMNSAGARHIRILCEYQQPWVNLEKENVKGTILFFGSARSKSKSQWDKEYASALEKEKSAQTTEEKEKAAFQIDRLKRTKWMIEWYEKARLLSRKLTEWCLKHIPCEVDERTSSVVVCTGGGPGMMEAANLGAYEASPHAKSIGMGISLPFEPRLNRFVRPDTLGFEFHYFFTRKFWMVYECHGLIVAPGGVGTCDELFEVMTLLQTGKISKRAAFPIVLLCKKFWTTIVNWDALVEFGTINRDDVDRLYFVDDVDEAYSIVRNNLIRSTVKRGEPLVPQNTKNPPTPTMQRKVVPSEEAPLLPKFTSNFSGAP